MAADPSSPHLPARVDHVSGLEALPQVTGALVRFEPAVLLTADGLGAIYASAASAPAPGRTLWFLADARAMLAWESSRRRTVTLTFLSADERVFLRVSGKAEVSTDHDRAARAWRPAFKPWFPNGAADARLLLVQFSADDAEFYEAAEGRVTAHLPE